MRASFCRSARGRDGIPANGCCIIREFRKVGEQRHVRRSCRIGFQCFQDPLSEADLPYCRNLLKDHVACEGVPEDDSVRGGTQQTDMHAAF